MAQIDDYPSLVSDQSYGLIRRSTDAAWVGEATPSRIHVPADNVLDTTWTDGNARTCSIKGISVRNPRASICINCSHSWPVKEPLITGGYEWAETTGSRLNPERQLARLSLV